MADGLANVQLRIAAIQRQFAVPPVQAAPTLRTSTTSATTGAPDFAALLQKATTANSPGVDTSKMANGRYPDSALVSIGGGERLVAPAANAFTSLRTAAGSAGIRFDVNDSYRSYDQQVEMARTKGLYGKGGLAAVPGTSTHGKGLSVDLELDAKAQGWMKANAKDFGWINDVKGEPWHWTYKP